MNHPQKLSLFACPPHQSPAVTAEWSHMVAARRCSLPSAPCLTRASDSLLPALRALISAPPQGEAFFIRGALTHRYTAVSKCVYKQKTFREGTVSRKVQIRFIPASRDLSACCLQLFAGDAVDHEAVVAERDLNAAVRSAERILADREQLEREVSVIRIVARGSV